MNTLWVHFPSYHPTVLLLLQKYGGKLLNMNTFKYEHFSPGPTVFNLKGFTMQRNYVYINPFIPLSAKTATSQVDLQVWKG